MARKASLSQEMASPQLGEIRRGTSLGFKDAHGHIWHACRECGKERWVRLTKGVPEHTRCTQCKGVEQSTFRGEQCSHWNGGRKRDKGGYILVYVPPDEFFYPMADCLGYVREHRLIMAHRLGRCLMPFEVVHHKNGKTDDNRIENLGLFGTNGAHLSATLYNKRKSKQEVEDNGVH